MAAPSGSCFAVSSSSVYHAPNLEHFHNFGWKKMSDAQSLLYRLEKATTLADVEICLGDVRDQWEKWSVLSEGGKLIKHLRDHAVNFYKLAEFQTCETDVSQETEQIRRVINSFGGTARLLATKLEFHQSMSRVLIELWNALSDYQAKFAKPGMAPRHVYKAGLAMYLAYIYLDQKEPGTAIWWLLLTQADDLLDEHGEKGGAGKDMLQLVFGVNDDVLEEMEKITGDCLSSREPHKLYAEHIVMTLALIPKYLWLFSYPTTTTEFPICRSYAHAMLSRLENDTTGSALEELARYLILLLSGWVPSPNLYAVGTRIDSDLIARYTREPQRISEAHGRTMLIECKNHTKPISVSQLGYFLYRMHLAQVDVGILFARNGISKRKQGDDARYAQRLREQAFQRDGKAVIVINQKTLESLANGDITLWSFISAELVLLRFGAQDNMV